MKLLQTQDFNLKKKSFFEVIFCASLLLFEHIIICYNIKPVLELIAFSIPNTISSNTPFLCEKTTIKNPISAIDNISFFANILLPFVASLTQAQYFK